MNIPLCILCNCSPHDSRCPYLLKDDEITETLSDQERELFQIRAQEWLDKPAKVQEFLNIATLITLQKLAKDALRPGGKDPATTSLRAIGEIVKKNADWMDGLNAEKSNDANPHKKPRGKVM